jgi:3-(3-hydroxy-phenyl)propionate hydroxylase
VTKLPGVLPGGQKLYWIPDAHYDEGFFAPGGHGAVGWQIPQPWVIDAKGATMRLDDLLDGRWAVLHTGALPAGVQEWAELGVPVIRLAGPHDVHVADDVRDSGGVLTDWLLKKKATALVVRPDGFVYAATNSGEPSPAPPAGFTGTTAPAPIRPIRNGVTA